VEFAPLAFLYYLRVIGGLAHCPINRRAGIAATGLGCPKRAGIVTDYLKLLVTLVNSLNRIQKRLEAAAGRIMLV
jgi:hypothetical protein